MKRLCLVLLMTLVFALLPGAGQADGPLLAYDAYAIDDDHNDHSSGDGDGVVDCGETIELYVNLRNDGGGAAVDVHATIYTSDPYVTFPFNVTSDYPNIAGGKTESNNDDFEFEVDSAAPNGHVIHFDLEITATNGGPWSGSFDVPVACPVPDIEVTPLSIEVTLAQFDVSEEILTIQNTGDAALDFAIYESLEAAATSTMSRERGEASHPSNSSLDAPAAASGKLVNGMPATAKGAMDLYARSTGDMGASGGNMLSFAAPDRPADLAWDGSHLWMVSEQSAKLYQLHPASGMELASFALPSHGQSDPNGWGLAWDGQYLWHSEYGAAQTIYQLNPSDGSIMRSFPAPADRCLGLAWDGTHLWTVDSAAALIYKLDRADGAVLHTIPAPGSYCAGLTWAGGSLWASDQSSLKIYRVAPADGKVLQYAYSPGDFPTGLTFDGLYLWHADWWTSTIYQMSTWIYPNVAYMSVEPSWGTVPAGASQDIVVTFNPTVLPSGIHRASFIIINNDPDENPVTVAVTVNMKGDQYEPNDEPAQAAAIECSDVITATINPSGDMDYFAFTLPAGWVIIADTDARVIGSKLDTVLTLFGSDGVTILASNDDYQGWDSHIEYRLPHDGTYYLRVRDFGIPHGGPKYKYRLSLDCIPPPDIDVSPDSFDVVLQPSQSAERPMIIRNTGSGELQFWIRKAPGSNGSSSAPQGTAPAATQVPLAEVEGASQPSSLEQAQGNEFAVGGWSLLAADGADVLLVYADYYPSQLRAFLRASPDTRLIDTWFAYNSIPTLSDLTPYDIVIAWNNAVWADPDRIGDVLADYHDVGGNVILAVDCWSSGIFRTGGRLITEQYSPFSSLGGAVFNDVVLGWYRAGHPLMDGVTSAAADFHNQVKLNPGAELVAEWHDGMPFVATKRTGGRNVLAINAHFWDGSPAWDTDAPLILQNAIGYLLPGAALPWISAHPGSGTVNAGESQEILVTFNSTGLARDIYSANLVVFDNDPDENPVTVPVTLLVGHPPQVGTVAPDSGSGPAGVTTYFATTWSDGDGWEDLKQCYFHIGANASVAGNVTLMYNAANNKLWLLNDAGTNWTGGHAPGSANVLENSQAIVHCGLTTVHGAGDTLGVTWAIEFKPGYTGAKKLGLKCKDRHGVKATAAWKGTWTIE